MTKYGIHTLDLPSLSRHAIGFERILHDLSKSTLRLNDNYPPYNVIQIDESHYTVEVAVAGFAESELDVELTDRVLTIKGKKPPQQDDQPGYIHKGISTRSFARTFTLADNVEVKSATVQNGILGVDLEIVVPEEQRPKKIAITFAK